MEPRRRTSLFGEPVERPDDGWESVSQLNSRVRGSLERSYGNVRVAGEISNLTVAYSGHLYFTLKDGDAQLSVVMWASSLRGLKFQPADGLAVNVSGGLTLYSPRGAYQLVARSMLLAGAGDLEVRFRQLLEEYRERGWFDERLKKPIPILPRTIGLVTSPRGAAIHDFLRTATARHPRLHVLLYPARVQGPGASREVAAGVRWFNETGRADVIVVTRGGGSLEDLWAFNEAPVIEAIQASEIPVISAVGHEIDVTVADWVADVRALTPTDAGNRVVPEVAELLALLAQCRVDLRRSLRERLAGARHRLETLARSWALREPRHLVGRMSQRLDDLTRRLAGSLDGRVERERERVSALVGQASRAVRETLVRRTESVHRADRQLQALSPLAVLSRGYSITLDDEGHVIDDPDHATDEIVTVLAKGRLRSRVEDRRRDDLPQMGTDF